VTCNYEARRRGLHKLQLIVEARRICPDVVIVLGEDLTRFRNASKALYGFLAAYTWNKKVERLGFDEVFMDVTDVVNYNLSLLNPNDLEHSFFQLSMHDPAAGFPFDATQPFGATYPATDPTISPPADVQPDCVLSSRLILGSHMAQHLRHRLEEECGYTSTVGISTSKLLSKLVGNVNKPKGQTILLPPYDVSASIDSNAKSNVTAFLDEHEIRKIPGIGFRMAHAIRNHVWSRPPDVERRPTFGPPEAKVTVGDVRRFPGMGPDALEKVLGGPGAEKGIGAKVWNLLNGIDDTEVREARKIPSQISIEDSYVRLDTLPQVLRELRILATSLLIRMHTDLLEDDDDESDPSVLMQRWIAHPKTLRLTTRPRLRLGADVTRSRAFNRISRSCPLPTFVFNLREGNDVLVERLVQTTLLPMFRQLHPEKHGWNLSLINVGVTNLCETASEDGSGGGRDIGKMFKRQEHVLKEWKVEDKDVPPDSVVMGNRASIPEPTDENTRASDQDDVQDLGMEADAEPSAGSEAIAEYAGSEDQLVSTQTSVDEDLWEEAVIDGEKCPSCSAIMPAFAMVAHERFHSLGES
jgi:DNA polymerase iota